MTWVVYVEQDWQRDTLRLHMFDRSQSHYVLLNPGGVSATSIFPEQAAPEPPVPALILPEDAAPALLAALSRHLGSVEHPEQLRKDYEAERARVDTFIRHLTAGSP